MIYFGKSESINIWVVKNTPIKNRSTDFKIDTRRSEKNLYQIKYCKYYRHELPRRGYIGRKTQIHKKRPHRQTSACTYN